MTNQDKDTRRISLRKIFQDKGFILSPPRDKAKADEFRYKAGGFLYFYWGQGKEPNIAIDPNIEYSGLLKLDGVAEYGNNFRYGTAMKEFPKKYEVSVPKDHKSRVGRMFVVREEALSSFLSGLASLLVTHYQNKDKQSISAESAPLLGEAQEPQDSATDSEDTTDSTAQGYENDPALRQAIEQYAVKLACKHYFGDGYQVKELGKPFDLLCEKQGEVIHVEVKGSRSMLDSVIVTINEIKDARVPNWRTDLFIVEGIVIEYDYQEEPKPDGGSSRVLRNWAPKDSDLMPSQFCYSLPERRDWIAINSDKQVKPIK